MLREMERESSGMNTVNSHKTGELLDHHHFVCDDGCWCAKLIKIHAGGGVPPCIVFSVPAYGVASWNRSPDEERSYFLSKDIENGQFDFLCTWSIECDARTTVEWIGKIRV